METDAIQVLKDMNREISGLFDLAAKTERVEEKTTLFQQIKDEIELYSLIEQRVLYPAIASFDELAETVDRVYDEHDEMSDLIDDIDQMEPDGDSTSDFETSIAELGELFSHHAEEEETELFPEIINLLDEDQLVSLGNQISELRGLGMAA